MMRLMRGRLGIRGQDMLAHQSATRQARGECTSHREVCCSDGLDEKGDCNAPNIQADGALTSANEKN